MRLVRTALVAMAISTLVSSPVAIAKEYAPPGKAGTSEYAEDIPTAGGNVQTPAMGGGNNTATEIDHLGSGKPGMRKLVKLGKAGSAAALFAQQTAPATTQDTSSRTRGRGNSHQLSGTLPQSTLIADGGSALSAISHLIGGSDVDGIGIVMPLLLAFGLGWVAAAGVLRLRQRSASGPPET
jgi:hypothetical protein